MNKKLEPAIRQYKHNDGSDGFVIAYDKHETEQILEQYLHEELQKLAGIMAREFGDRTGRFISLYATVLKEDFIKSQ